MPHGFERHGLTHVSISSLNKWRGSPSSWVAQYLHKVRFPASSAMWRGIVVEDAVKAVITNGDSVEDATERALADFQRHVMFDDDGKAGKEAENIPPMIGLAVDNLADYGKPDFPKDDEGRDQHMVKMRAKTDDWSIDMIGYLDFVYPEKGLIVDLKTTLKMPSVMSHGHQLQRAFYETAAGNKECKFLYVTPKKAEWKADGDATAHMRELKEQITRLERFLALGDKEFLASIVPVDPEDWYWKGAEDRRREMFGI